MLLSYTKLQVIVDTTLFIVWSNYLSVYAVSSLLQLIHNAWFLASATK